MMKKFSRIFAFLFLVLGLVVCFSASSCTPNEQPEVEKFDIVLPNVEHGQISASSTLVEKGQSVELTVTPDSNYELEYLKSNDEELVVTNNNATIENVTENQIRRNKDRDHRSRVRRAASCC